jgi:hypothetical protein
MTKGQAGKKGRAGQKGGQAKGQAWQDGTVSIPHLFSFPFFVHNLCTDYL